MDINKDNVINIRINELAVPINGQCFICYEPSTIWEFQTTICERCSRLWKSGYGDSVEQIRTKLNIFSEKYKKTELLEDNA